jgi:hypothetical protein
VTARKATAKKRRHIGFRGLESRVEREYLRKGFSRTRARAIGRATAGKVATAKRRKRR